MAIEAGSSTYYQAKRGIVQDGLVCNLDFSVRSSYNTGTSITNIAGSGYNASMYNGPVLQKNRSGGSFLNFDGTNDYLTINGLTSHNDNAWTANASTGSDQFCFEIWHKGSDFGWIVSKPWNGSGNYNIALNTNGFSVRDNSGSNNFNWYGTGYIDNTWQQIVIWADSTNMGVFINGATRNIVLNKLHGLTGGTPTNWAMNLVLMSIYSYGEGWVGNTTYAKSGGIGAFRKYNKVLSSNEVSQNYNVLRHRFGL